jgi:hypothetical protein
MYVSLFFPHFLNIVHVCVQVVQRVCDRQGLQTVDLPAQGKGCASDHRRGERQENGSQGIIKLETLSKTVVAQSAVQKLKILDKNKCESGAACAFLDLIAHT